MSSYGVQSPLTLEHSCSIVAAALSQGRRRGVRLLSGDQRGFCLRDERTVVGIPYPALDAAWTQRTLTCGIALQSAPSKDRLAAYPLAELTGRELRALTLVEAKVALGWLTTVWPGLLPDFQHLLPTLEPLDGGLAGPVMFELATALAASKTEVHCDPLLGQLPLGLPARSSLTAAVRKMRGRMPWSVGNRALPPGFDTIAVAGESQIKNPNLAPERKRADDDDFGVYVAQRPGVPYPEWNVWTNSLLRDHVAVLERRHGSGAGRAKPSNLALRRFFEEPTHRASRTRLEDGADLDIDAYIAHFADAVAGVASEPRVYRDLLPASRDVATALLLDASSSLGSSHGQIFKLELACADALCRAMARANEQHALFTFNGKTRHRVNINCLKDFSDRQLVVPSDLGLLTGGYTRLGAPLRHLTRRLLAQPAERRLLIVIGDGMISDESYEGRYAWADSAHAVEEANEAGVAIYYIGVGRARVDPLPEVFGARRSTRIVRVEELPAALARVHRELVST